MNKIIKLISSILLHSGMIHFYSADSPTDCSLYKLLTVKTIDNYDIEFKFYKEIGAVSFYLFGKQFTKKLVIYKLQAFVIGDAPDNIKKIKHQTFKLPNSFICYSDEINTKLLMNIYLDFVIKELKRLNKK